MPWTESRGHVGTRGHATLRDSHSKCRMHLCSCLPGHTGGSSAKLCDVLQAGGSCCRSGLGCSFTVGGTCPEPHGDLPGLRKHFYCWVGSKELVSSFCKLRVALRSTEQDFPALKGSPYPLLCPTPSPQSEEGGGRSLGGGDRAEPAERPLVSQKYLESRCFARSSPCTGASGLFPLLAPAEAPCCTPRAPQAWPHPCGLVLQRRPASEAAFSYISIKC